jgi:DNA (cytosine-5)-methyltransferase 1
VNYYNDINAKACEDIRRLVGKGWIPAGRIDQRSIAEVGAAELGGYQQCHFFAGIAGWAEALRLADWPEEWPVWTGSCPCQPFSQAGKRKGAEDEWHLWPVLRGLISQCRPPVFFGEQVESEDGRNWLAVVRAEMEELGYAVGAADLCAAGIGAPHRRQRLYFVGLADADGRSGDRAGNGRQAGRAESADGGSNRRMADADGDGCKPRAGNDPAARYGDPAPAEGGAGGLADADNVRCAEYVSESGWRAAAIENDAAECAWDVSPGGAREGDGFWGAADWLWCRDARWRPVEPGSFPLVNGLSDRMAAIRGYGNAIVPQCAAVFIRSVMDVMIGGAK